MVSRSIMGLYPSFMLIWDKPILILAVSLWFAIYFHGNPNWSRKTTKFYSPNSGAELGWELGDKLPMGKTQKRTNHHNRINNFMAWEALNWHSNSCLSSSPKWIDWILWHFSLSLRFQMWSTHHRSFAAPWRLPQCKPSVQDKKLKDKKTACWKEFNLLLHHLKFRQATITGTGSYHVRAENRHRTEPLASLYFTLSWCLFSSS